MIRTRSTPSVPSGSGRTNATGAPLAAVVLVALVPLVPLSGQSVLLRLAPEEGQVSRYEMRMRSDMEAPMMPASEEPFMVAEISSTQTVTAVDGDVREYEVVTDSARFDTPAMPALAANMPDLTGQTQTMRMDVRGQVVGFEVSEDVPAQVRQAMSRMGGGFGIELPEEPVSPGDSWQGTQEMDMSGVPGQAMAMKMDVTYTLESVDGEVAVISYAGPVTMDGPDTGMQVSGRVSGTMSLDFAVGRLVESDMEMTMDMSIQGQTMKLAQQMSLTLIGG